MWEEQLFLLTCNFTLIKKRPGCLWNLKCSPWVLQYHGSIWLRNHVLLNDTKNAHVEIADKVIINISG